MKTFYSILLTLALLVTAHASEVVRNTTFADGQQLHASDLHNLIDTATIGQAFYNDQLTIPNLGSGMYFLVLDPATQLYRRLAAANVLYGNTNIFLYAVKSPTIPSWATLDFFDPTNVSAGVQGITVSNLFGIGSSNINFAFIPFATTNSAGATVYTLPNWAQPIGGFQTNNQQELLIWGTNGVPYQMTFTNFEQNLAGDFGTNLGLTYTYRQLFAPWTVYGTNVAYTNIWGVQTNFAITNLLLANPGGTNWPTLVDTDSVPVFATQQGTNTTATLLAIYQYMTNKNALPAYTTARVQFSGLPASMIISNNTSVANGSILMMTNANWGTNFFATNVIYAVSFITNAAPIFGGMQTNTAYYIVPPATNSVAGEWVHVFSNYTSAAVYLQNGSPTNYIAITGSGFAGTANTMLYLTNFTGFNADAVQVVTPGAPAAIRSGVFDIWFRSPAANALYYVTGTTPPDTSAGYSSYFNLASDRLVTTNRVRVYTAVMLNTSIFPEGLTPTYVLISPQ